MEIQGHCDEKFARVREEFEKNFSERGDVGACFAVTLEGEYVVDIRGGYRDADRSLPWEEDTIVNVYSTTKTMTALCALILADRGELDFNAPVMRYWPEFGAAGKEKVEVRHLMSHSAGLPAWDGKITPQVLYDWEDATTRLAAQAPWWEPGTQSGYHSISQGHLVGEVVRRITGRSIGTFFRDEVAEPLQADFHIGVDPSNFSRIADLIPAPAAEPQMELPADSIMGRVFTNVIVDAEETRTDAWRRAEIPAANGHGNAHAVVRAQTALANGGSAFGVELLSESGCSKALEEQTNGADLVLGIPIRFGMGYGLPGEAMPVSPSANAHFWGGAGGSTIVVDQDARLCFSYVMNQMQANVVGDPRGGSLGQAVYQSLGML